MKNQNTVSVITIIGSLRHADTMDRFARDMHKDHVVLTPYLPLVRKDYSEDEVSTSKLEELGLRRIDLADTVWLVAPDGYYGESTSKEVRYAVKTGKPLELFMEPGDSKSLSEFMVGFQNVYNHLKEDGLEILSPEETHDRIFEHFTREGVGEVAEKWRKWANE